MTPPPYPTRQEWTDRTVTCHPQAANVRPGRQAVDFRKRLPKNRRPSRYIPVFPDCQVGFLAASYLKSLLDEMLDLAKAAGL